MGLYCLFLSLTIWQLGLTEIAKELHPPRFQLISIFPEFTGPVIVQRDTEVPKIVCLIDFVLGFEVNLSEDYGQFS